jgi:translocator protein
MFPRESFGRKKIMNSSPPIIAPYRQLFALIGWLLLCFAAASTGVFISKDDWYDNLIKPDWNPPGWIFAPVWTVLYFLMAVAAWLVWRAGGWKAQWPALSLFLCQILLNALWTPVFFGWHRPDLAFALIIALGLTLKVTICFFFRVNKTSAFLLIPYSAWVSFAAALNFVLWQLNP